ncbi:UDP-N-acetylmuramate--L-alanine ligase [Candidatus Sumerlaeota bacterium]|nr:UDP-N-acetylmuramate--L-alanine ligase [Candidatus Sumerlaeota bacterium]
MNHGESGFASQSGFSASVELTRVHMIGICGSGMKPLAQALLTIGVKVSGSDPNAGSCGILAEMGAKLYDHHSADHIAGQDCVVYSTAISSDNEELVAARQCGIPVIHRSEMLGWFLARRESVLVAGTHGKTTSTTLLTLLLERQGADPWGFIGGTVKEFGGNVRIGKGIVAIAEADESDGSFHNLPRTHAMITNIEAEHLNYWGSEEKMFEGFAEFVQAMPKDGHLVICVDDPGCRRLLSSSRSWTTTYSVDNPSADFYAASVRMCGEYSTFDLMHNGRRRGRVMIGIPGRQNIANAIGAFAMALKLGCDFEVIRDALSDFHGVDRRFTKRVAPNGALIIDDYGHHPTEMAATIAAARLLAEERAGRLLAVVQPHRYSRTQSFFKQFGPALRSVDHVIITEIYSAGEDAIEGISGESLRNAVAEQVTGPVEFIPEFDQMKKSINAWSKNNDIVLLLGAGSITKLAPQLAQPAGITAQVP